jgi:hypothetical protein
MREVFRLRAVTFAFADKRDLRLNVTRTALKECSHLIKIINDDSIMLI